MIEGYFDSQLLGDISQRSLYDGGDVRLDAFVQMGRPKAQPSDAEVSLYAGGIDDSQRTRRIVSRLGQKDVSLPTREWKTADISVISSETVYDSDGQKMKLEGTDGAQFRPNIDPKADDKLTFFSADWARDVELVYNGTYDSFVELETLQYVKADSAWRMSDGQC